MKPASTHPPATPIAPGSEPDRAEFDALPLRNKNGKAVAGAPENKTRGGPDIGRRADVE